jgi:hypothetical protein
VSSISDCGRARDSRRGSVRPADERGGRAVLVRGEPFGDLFGQEGEVGLDRGEERGGVGDVIEAGWGDGAHVKLTVMVSWSVLR